ncbi:MAG: hypothetical protein K9J16_09055 [Melioribacteraceae bacterium]|nr:hypothetical protein [Melioribacteraceae bacterium]MCF8353246.1 hypothetical protein [Melioribacteraceae bacterium]MCF8393978.1 hypothetical protein [Melioribacteraceae bacterium]MCF8418720.1 hypothetical protein [Melioribacteraceae bacterium]
MIPEIRNDFNSNFNENTYNNFLEEIWSKSNGINDFRINETPLFMDAKFSDTIQRASNDLAAQINNPEFLHRTNSALPKDWDIPNEGAHPNFLQFDFAVIKNENGEHVPMLIELQGFASLYSFQAYLDVMIRKYFQVPEKFHVYFNGFNFQSYIAKLKKIIVADYDPKTVVLLEIQPNTQKTRIDFNLTKEFLGIETVCVTEVYSKSNKLFYKLDGSEIQIKRIYNRVIFDELINKNITPKFDLKDEYDVEWTGHPNWFFRISKHTLPLLSGEFVPKCFYLNDLRRLPDDLENYVLKPLFSFAGSGVQIDVTREILDKIPDRENYILQEKVNYEPIIKTPDGENAKAEIRMMYLWDNEPVLVNNLLRTSKGKMMGVDYNKNKTWIGASIAYHKSL